MLLKERVEVHLSLIDSTLTATHLLCGGDAGMGGQQSAARPILGVDKVLA